MKVVGVVDSPIRSGLYDSSNVSGGNAGTRTRSCMGFPGSNLPAAYLYMESTVTVVVTDGNDVYAAVNGGWTGNGSITGSEFPCRMYVKPYWFEITDPFTSTDQILSFTMTKGSSSIGNIRYDFASVARPSVGDTSIPGGYSYIGKIWDFSASDNGQDGVGWIAGSAYYSMTDPIYPAAEAFTIPGFVRFFDYYPWARRIGGSWYSCNRDGGSLKARKSGAWQDRKNRDNGVAADASVFARNRDGSWRICPKL